MIRKMIVALSMFISKKWYCVSLALCGVIFATSALAAPVKMAMVESLSGPQASTGILYLTAVRYVINSINATGGWGGEQIQLIEYDNQGGTSGASDKVKAAIADGVQVIIQGSSSAVAGQITEDVRKHNLRNPGKELLYLNFGGEALELTGEKNHFYHFRFCTNSDIRVKALVSAMKQAGVLGKNIYSMNQNYSWGLDMQNAILGNAPQGGYQIVGTTLHDVNKIQDFSPYIAKIKDAKPDTVITGNWSNDLLLLMKAAHSANLKIRFATCFLDQPGNLANAGDSALGSFVAHPLNIEAAGKEGDKFAQAYKAKTGHLPSYVEPQAVYGMMLLEEALKKVKPEAGTLNITSLAKALENAQITTPLGKATIRSADHQVIMPIAVSVVSKDAKYKVDGTNMGFKPVKVFTAEEAAVPVQASNKLQRPK